MNYILKKIKHFLKKYFSFLIIYCVIFISFIYPLPYYINYTGGIINVLDKINIDANQNINISGSINMSYVSEIKATIPTLLIAKLNKNWDIYKEQEIVSDNETIKEMNFRNKTLLKESNNSAIIYAYKKSNRDVSISDEKLYVTYIDSNSDTGLKIGDQIVKINNIMVKSKSDVTSIIETLKIGDIVKIGVIRENKQIEVTAKIFESYSRKVIGIVITEDKKITTEPNIDILFKQSETGPSGGMMLCLGIYSVINNIDLTNGKIIAGTGTIDENGNVGSISGIKYKLAGAVKDNASIFFAPNGENYEEAINLKKENKYNIQIIGVNTFDELVKYLEKYN